MKRFKIKPGLRIAGVLFLFVFISCTANRKPKEAPTGNDVFPKGQKAPSEHFTGTAWVYGLVGNDSLFTTLAGNVTFEPSARTHWHSHPAGQILIVTSGIGYHQIEGGLKEIIKKGDVVKCPPDKLHWHGASENSSCHTSISFRIRRRELWNGTCLLQMQSIPAECS